MIGNSDDETNFSHTLWLTNRQVKNLHKAFANNLSVNIKQSKTQLSKIIQSSGFLGGPGLQLMKNVFQPSAKTVLIPLRLTAAAADTGIHKKTLGLEKQH